MSCERHSVYRTSMVWEAQGQEGMQGHLQAELFNGGSPNGIDCPDFIIRQLFRDEKTTLRGGGKRSNPHVFEHTRRRVTPEELGLRAPSLNVARHIRKGRDINKED